MQARTTTTASVRVAVVDPRPLFRRGVLTALASQGDLTPAGEAVDGAGAVLAGLSGETYAKAIADLASRRVDLELPKFSFTSAYELSDALKALGMPLAFDPAQADFSGITTQEKLWIAAVLHKAFVAVDEEGTEAAAATAVLMEGKSMPRPEEPVKVIVDRPFLVVIRHVETGEILFLGRITDPTKK